jgi:cytochrome c-type biogenesis protein CcmE
MRRNRKFGVGALILLGAIGYLVYAGVQQGSVYYFKIDEFWTQKEALADQGVRVAGRVAKGSVAKQMTSDGTDLRFTLGEFPNGESNNGTHGLTVHFTGVVPDMFAEGRDVIVEGTYSKGMLEAHTLMTSCPSKYEAGKEQPGAGGARAS